MIERPGLFLPVFGPDFQAVQPVVHIAGGECGERRFPKSPGEMPPPKPVYSSDRIAEQIQPEEKRTVLVLDGFRLLQATLFVR